MNITKSKLRTLIREAIAHIKKIACFSCGMPINNNAEVCTYCGLENTDSILEDDNSDHDHPHRRTTGAAAGYSRQTSKPSNYKPKTPVKIVLKT